MFALFLPLARFSMLILLIITVLQNFISLISESILYFIGEIHAEEKSPSFHGLRFTRSRIMRILLVPTLISLRN